MIRYSPLLSVVTDRTFSIRAGLDASTVTPGRTAPDVSLTTPVMDACAAARAGTSTTHASNGTISRATLRICVSLSVAGTAARFQGSRPRPRQRAHERPGERSFPAWNVHDFPNERLHE